MFIAYDGLTIEGEELVRAADNPTSSARNQLLATQSTDGADMASSTVNINGVSNNSNEIDKQGRFNPNVVAISLEIGESFVSIIVSECRNYFLFEDF